MSLNRRAFLTGSGALVVALALPGCARAVTAGRGAWRLSERLELRVDGEAWVHIGRIEMGQGLYAAMLQLAAEELDLPLERLRLGPVDTASAPDEGFTDASASMRRTGLAVRQAAAEARALLVALAAERWQLPGGAVTTRDGQVLAPDGRALDYAELLGAARRLPRVSARLKAPADYRLLGRAMPRPDLEAKVRGAAVFIQDLHLPDMVHARVLRPPSPAARLVALERTAVLAAPGVLRLVRDGSFVAVLAQREEQAIQALELLRRDSRWHEEDSLPDPAGLYERLTDEAGPVGLPVAPNAGWQTAEYRFPYRLHGALGPSCALALWQGERLTVWTHAQGIFALRDALGELLELPTAAVRCIHREGAGCYGHNGADDAAADAALLARALPGVPVRVQWSRTDEHRWEPYGPAMVVRLAARLDTAGRLAAWHQQVISPTHSSRPGGATRLLAARHLARPQAPGLLQSLTTWAGGGGYNGRPYYRVAASLDNVLVRRPPLRSSALRSLGAYANVLAIEGLVDELAARAGQDPLAFRLAQLDDPRARAVLHVAAAHCHWRTAETTTWGLGFARLNGHGAYVAVCAEAVRDDAGQPLIQRLVAAVDCGELVDPDTVRSQIEGGLVQALSWTLYEAVRFDRRHILSADWEGYPVLRIATAPAVEVQLIDQPGQPYLGVGEAAQGPGGAAVANAVARLTGQRRRTLPLLGAP